MIDCFSCLKKLRISFQGANRIIPIILCHGVFLQCLVQMPVRRHIPTPSWFSSTPRFSRCSLDGGDFFSEAEAASAFYQDSGEVEGGLSDASEGQTGIPAAPAEQTANERWRPVNLCPAKGTALLIPRRGGSHSSATNVDNTGDRRPKTNLDRTSAFHTQLHCTAHPILPSRSRSDST